VRRRAKNRSMNTDENDWVSKVLGFWFDELEPKDWFEVNAEVDAKIAESFSALHKQLSEADTKDLAPDPDTALAATIVLYQFSRNMFRKTGKAFAFDGKALAIAKSAVERGFVEQVPEKRRTFFRMPFMHSEDIDDQQRCLDLFLAAGDENSAKYAREHLEIIRRFGRFPHRNQVLGRPSTPEEISFLEGHSGFGQ
jgi:uncharacterized protein (DUF924 family)